MTLLVFVCRRINRATDARSREYVGPLLFDLLGIFWLLGWAT